MGGGGRANRLAVKIQLGAAVDAGVGAIVVTVAVVIIIIVVVAAVVGGRVTTSSLFKDGLHHQPDGATYESWHLRVFNG